MWKRQHGNGPRAHRRSEKYLPGRVVQINRKPLTPGEHGLPKISTPRAHVTIQGVEDDFNIYRHEKKNDTPDRALLLYTVETIAILNKEGWPLRPGDIGENVTLEGIDYDALQPGTEWLIGDGLRIRVTEPCNPCKVLAALPYVGETRKREFIETLKGRRGWYAKVLREGSMEIGDAFVEAL